MPSLHSTFKGSLILLLYCGLCNLMHAQELNEKQFLDDFKGNISITNNGISLVPTFSLGEPALLFDFKLIKKRFSFEPDMRFALEGKPWSFLFWCRYKALQKDKFSLRVGAHPALNFRTINLVRNGKAETILETRRYVAAEVVPNYKFTDHVSIGIYYLLGHGFDAGVKTTNFLTLNATLSNVYLFEKYYFNLSPQIYFLSLDDLKGNYAVAFVSLKREKFPVSLGVIFNKAIHTEIIPEQDFTWNITLTWSFLDHHRPVIPAIQ